MKNRWIDRILLLLFLILVNSRLSVYVYQFSASRELTAVSLESEEFRRQRMNAEIIDRLLSWQTQSSMELGEILTVLGTAAGRNLSGKVLKMSGEELVRWKKLLMTYDPEGYQRVSRGYGAIWDDLECFPVDCEGTVYENTWMFERNYGGIRGHEGCDLIPPEDLPGHYRIFSMTDGVVEKIGWLPKGGYRIGIRSPSGGYFYYAHFDSYEHNFREGDVITAGTLLGRMGDTGYGAVGTKGKFPVHLHLGIYISTENDPEMAVNPYWILRYLQTNMCQDSSKGSVATSN